MDDHSHLLEALIDDPWSLTHEQRVRLLEGHRELQSAWLNRLQELVEPPRPGPDFPAFLLALPPFDHVVQAIGNAERLAEMDVATADLVQRFVDHFAHWLVSEQSTSVKTPAPAILPFDETRERVS